MMETLTILLRIAGAGLLLLAVLHIPIGKQLKWREDAKRLTPVNTSIFHVHTFFICMVLVMMGLPCLLEPGVFLEKSRAGAWLAWSACGFWALRLYFQWFVYPANLWPWQANGNGGSHLVHYGLGGARHTLRCLCLVAGGLAN